MKKLTFWLAVLIASSAFVPAQAVEAPPPRYVKKAIFVRMLWDRSFYEYWHDRKGKSNAQINSMLLGYFNTARADYLNNSALHNIDLILLDDVDRVGGSMASFTAAAPVAGRDARLLAGMRSRLQTGAVNKTVPSGSTHLIGRTINWVFVYGNYGDQQGAVDTVSGLNTGNANLFVSTSGGDTTVAGVYYPLSEQLASVVAETLLHETGHLLGGQHGAQDELADCKTSHKEIMCGRTGLGRERRFGTANFNRTLSQVKSSLQRCNSAFSTQNSCNQFVTEMCASSTVDYSQIQYCIDFNQGAMCQDICSSAQKNARVVINSLSSTIGSNVVSAPAAYE
jgi:hypothetical protein